MPRKKKSRKVGQIGIPKASNTSSRKVKEKRIKKPKGKPAGSRNSEIQETGGKPTQAKNLDPRHGSKTPIDLFKSAATKQEKPIEKVKYFSPEKELEALENDPRFIELADKSDSNTKLTREESHYLQGKLSRHKELCEMLGLNEDPNPETNSTDTFTGFESLDMDDYSK